MRRFCKAYGVVLLLVVSCAQAQDFQGPDTAQLQVGQNQITAVQANALEEKLVTNPNNLAVREQLIRYYFNASLSSRAVDLEQKREQHILWLIEHQPESELAGSPEADILPMGINGSTDFYQLGKQRWLEQAKKYPNNPRVLMNAAQFLFPVDQNTARDLLEKALTLDPGNPEISSKLAQLYEQQRMNATSSNEKDSLAQKALSIRESGIQKATAEQRFYELGDLATSALEAGDAAKAEQYASELLQDAQAFKTNWNYGNAVHKGNIVLGRIALQRHDIEGAKKYLLLAGETPGSPQLDSFGPNMTLAKGLLERGEQEVVISYLQSCEKFWKMGGVKLQSWIATVKAGGTPDFSANLDY
jgi:tetratricopeptide (TPR) repeat protein